VIPDCRQAGLNGENMFYVYVLMSQKDRKRYIGQTMDLNQRLSEHNMGLVKSTKSRRPLKLVYFEEYNTREEECIVKKN